MNEPGYSKSITQNHKLAWDHMQNVLWCLCFHNPIIDLGFSLLFLFL